MNGLTDQTGLEWQTHKNKTIANVHRHFKCNMYTYVSNLFTTCAATQCHCNYAQSAAEAQYTA